jgi:mannose-1-phosphate guanylyltransferase
MGRGQLEKRRDEEVITVDPTWHTTLAHLWGIVLAGGEGRRLQSFVRACFGCERPKQFCAFLDGCSMLQHTLKRAEHLIPPTRLLTIVTQAHLPHALAELRDQPAETMIVQPLNRETGPGILLPLLHVLRRDPEAVVVLLPSDHFIPEEGRFMASVAHAAMFVAAHPEFPVLLGVEPSGPEIEYGWIETGELIEDVQGEAVHRVRRFWEKPTCIQANTLYLHGWLWNTMVLVAQATVLLGLFQRFTPGLVCAFQRIQRALGLPYESEVLQEVYAQLPAINFSQAILTQCPQRLGVLRVQDIYWSDWGDPTRIQQDCARFARHP